MRSLDRYLQEAGLLQVEAQRIQVPLGDWGGRLGSLLSLDARETWKAISAPIAARFQLPEQEVLDLIDRASQEWNELQTKWSLAIAYGQKPAAS
ncbi:hypothetical protein [Thermogemmatispora sp.]|nr:hypothetical protein [Thermogemmatispora sp.]